MRKDAQEALAKSYETSDMENRIWREMVEMDTVDKKKPTKKFVGRNG